MATTSRKGPPSSQIAVRRPFFSLTEYSDSLLNLTGAVGYSEDVYRDPHLFKPERFLTPRSGDTANIQPQPSDFYFGYGRVPFMLRFHILKADIIMRIARMPWEVSGSEFYGIALLHFSRHRTLLNEGAGDRCYVFTMGFQNEASYRCRHRSANSGRSS